MKKAKSYPVGYGKPPKHTRFKPGQSGNPKGRPKKARSIEDEWKEELKQLVSVTENGRTFKITKQRAVIKSTIAKGIKGETRSVQIVLANIEALRAHQLLEPEELDALDLAILEDFRRG